MCVCVCGCVCACVHVVMHAKGVPLCVVELSTIHMEIT